MKIFVDTGKIEEIKKANDMGVICGVTTNPSLIAKEGRDFNEVIREMKSNGELAESFRKNEALAKSMTSETPVSK